jgi:hypothetical protein
MSTGYERVSPEEIESERLRFDKSRPEEVSGDTLPFVQLGGQRFEILAFLLRKACATSEELVTLVKSSGDRGRDVLVHRSGELIEVIQCKNQTQRMSRPDVLREFIKLALHSYLDTSLVVVGQPATLSLWCTGGFTEPAATLVDRRAHEDLDVELSSLFVEVKETYKAFGALTWDMVSTHMQQFRQAVSLRKEDNVSLTPPLRADSGLRMQFFTALNVVSVEEVTGVIKRMVEENFIPNRTWRQISSDEIRHIVDRIINFSDDTRSFFGVAHILGLPTRVLQDMSTERRARFLTAISRPIAEVSALLGEMAAEKALELVNSSLSRMTYTSRGFSLVVHQCLINQGMLKVARLAIPSTSLESLSSAILVSSTDLWYCLDVICFRMWDSLKGILALPIIDDVPDERMRRELARNCLESTPDRTSFVEGLKLDCQRNLPAIRGLVQELEDYLPTKLMLIVDSSVWFDDPALANSLLGSLRSLDKLGTELP